MRSKSQQCAFTLIELLVVVSLIVLLVALLMPALGRVRETAQQVHCASNLRQIADGVSTYVTETQGWLPTHDGGGANPFVTYWMNKTPPPAAGLTRVNLGLLLDRMPEPALYYDVSLTSNPLSALSYNGPDNLWNDSNGDSINRLRSSYPARSRQAEIGKTGTTYWRLGSYSGKALYSDFVGVDDWNGGGIIDGKIYSPHRGRGVNSLFADMSVRWSDATKLNDYRPIGPSTPSALDQWNYYQILDESP